MQKQLASQHLLIITSSLPFDEWTQTFGSEPLTSALLGRLIHHTHTLAKMNGDSYHLKQSHQCLASTKKLAQKPAT